MASGKKPKGFGPVSDDLVKLLEKALRGSGWAKKKKAQRIGGKIRERGGVNLKTGEYITKSQYPKGVNSRNYRRDFPEEHAMAKKFVDKAKATKKANADKASQRRADEAAIKRAANDKRIIDEQERTLRATRLGDAAASKGSKTRGGKEIPMSKKKAEEAARQGRMAGAQRKKGNAAKRAKAAELNAAIKNAKNAAERRAAMQRRRKFRDDTGF